MQIVTNVPVAGARVGAAFGAATTDGEGRFTLRPASPSGSAARLTVEAPDYVPRELTVRLDGGGRRDLVIDLMGPPPFALPFYEEFARDRLDNQGRLRALAPVVAPRYLVVTRHTGGGTVAASLVARVRATAFLMAQEFGDGRASPSITEIDAAPANAAGHIVITFTEDAASATCAEASIGAETGFVRFFLGVPACTCADSADGLAPVIIRHELGHTLGAYHVSNDVALMNAQPRCNATATSLERFHASVLFRRPRGNLSPDADPPDTLTRLTGPATTACRLSALR